MIFYTADLHFLYEPLLSSRPFATVEGMDETLIRNWNETVSPEDTVYLVGDIGYNEGKVPHALLSCLTGHKHLIRGNHDTGYEDAASLYRYFETITDFNEIDDGETHILLCHYPIIYRKRGYMIHGHIHQSRGQEYQLLKELPRVLNAGVDINLYRPVTLEELANSAYDSGNIRFGYGVSQEQYDSRNTTGLRGMRLVSNVATLSFTQAHAYVDVPANAGDEYLASAATCTENAKYYTKVCANCNAMAEPVEKAGTALGHKWNDGVVTVLPTIDKEGVMTYTCSVCSTTKTEPIAKLSDSDTDQSAANEVINLINSIGKVSKSSKDAIKAARKAAYNALTPEQQALVRTGGAWAVKKNRKVR